MNSSTLVRQNLKHFWRTNLAVILGVATAVAVLAGALLVGDSVRGSLRELALARLGNTDFVIAGQSFFREELAAELQTHDKFAASFKAACSLIALEGVVTRDDGARAGGVQIYGVDERFWQFHGVAAPALDGNDVLVSSALAQELSAKADDTLVLRLEKPSAIPAESLHGRKDDLGRTIRLTMRAVLPRESLGEFSLRPQQGAVRALFLPLKKLQRNVEQEGKANVILLSAQNSSSSSSPQLAAQILAAQILKDKFTLADLGVKLRVLEPQRVLSLESDSAVISDLLAEKVKADAAAENLRVAPILTYLANAIRAGERSIPYSLVTATNELWPQAGDAAAEPPRGAILNEWAARDLGVKVGDELTFEFYVWREEGTLDTQKAAFPLERIVPIQGLAADRDLAPEYPGITEAKSLADWDPPFPLDLSLVRKVDEEYWDEFRTTPKAFLPLAAGQKLWATRYGKLTSMRLLPAPDADLTALRNRFAQRLRASLDPVQMGLQIQAVKEQSLQASRGATDFGQYFTYFSFFLVVSALLLTTLFFRLGIEQRLREIGLLRAIGFSLKQVRGLFLREGVLLSTLGSLVGIVGGIAYAALLMLGLRTWWVGAVGTTLLRLHITPPALLIGALSGIVAAVLCIWWTLRSLREASPRSLLAGVIETAHPLNDGVRRSWFRFGKSAAGAERPRRFFTAARWAVLFGALGLALLLSAALKLIGQVGGFFGAGFLLLIAALCFWSAWLKRDRRQTIHGAGWQPLLQLGVRNASLRPGRSVLCIALIASAAFIIVSVDAFRRDGGAATLDKKSSNGGYPLLAESLLPLVYDLNSAAGREELNLTDDVLRNAQVTKFRLRPGDDASCLNLYEPRNPRILGVTPEFIQAGRFAFQASLAKTEESKANPWLLLEQKNFGETTSASSGTPYSDSGIPVIADANSLTYVLHRALGDTITITGDDGGPVQLRVVATLSDSLFQGELLMSEQHFKRVFPAQEGYRFFLLDTPPQNAAGVATALEEKLSDFGFDATPTEDRLASFHQVENTYLSTFQALGGLGLLLGTLGLATVLLRNVLERRRELALLRAVGYQPSHLSWMVLAENLLLLGCGLLTGTLCAVLAILPAMLARGGRFSSLSLALLLLAVLVTGLAASLVAVRAVVRSPLIPALRSE